MSKFKSDNIIGAGDAVAVREQQDMTEHDRSEVPADLEKQDSTMIKPRAEMITEWRERRYLGDDDPLGFDESLAAMMARRDEMVIEACIKEIYRAGDAFPATVTLVRALKGKLR